MFSLIQIIIERSELLFLGSSDNYNNDVFILVSFISIALDSFPSYRLIFQIIYNDVNATGAVIGRCPWSIRVQIHESCHGKLVFFVLFNMARSFENVCEILSDWGKIWNSDLLHPTVTALLSFLHSLFKLREMSVLYRVK